MKSCIIVLVAVGMAAGISNSKTKLTVYGLIDGDSIRNNLSPFLELRSALPHTHLFNIPLAAEHPLLSLRSLNDLPLWSNPLHNHQTSLRDVFRQPAVLVLKNKPEVTALEAYVLENGLSSLTENPRTRSILDKIKKGAELNAVVANSAMMRKSSAFKILKDMPINKIEIPGSIKFTNLARCLNTDVPLILIQEKEDLDTFDWDVLMRLGSLDVSDKEIQCSSC